MSLSRENIKKIYKSLPEELNRVVATQETFAINDEVAKMYNLDKQQRLELGDEVTMRLLGLSSENDFVKNLETRLKTSPEISQKIADDVKSKILSKIPEKILRDQENRVNIQAVKLSNIPEILPTNLPMVEKGEVVHEVPHESPARQDLAGSGLEKPKMASVPDYRYEKGKDPYREPLK